MKITVKNRRRKSESLNVHYGLLKILIELKLKRPLSIKINARFLIICKIRLFKIESFLST